MIVIREKSFGQVKRENKAKKKAWEEKVGKDHIRESYQKYLDDAKRVGYNNTLDISDYGKEQLRMPAESIISNRKYRNFFNTDKVKSLPKISWDEVARKYGRSRLHVETLEDKLDEKSQIKKYIGGLENYYKSKLDRRKFDKLKGKNERDLVDFLKSERNITSTENSSKKSSTPFSKRVKRLFKRNINKLIK